ncbi:hypothetical protein XU18_0817 [Perkinsela sp. CCAP 1560/4]|nr:hypothetical protein XU18_0817 [Perkinsela sp. CCAP 1560/4]|eukprot:KNH08697.1 hypothetical protein XU18_0817 [Perkinsela sp. CCAP 1560/4]
MEATEHGGFLGSRLSDEVKARSAWPRSQVQSPTISRIVEEEKSRRSSVLCPPEEHSPSARGMRWLQNSERCPYSQK